MIHAFAILISAISFLLMNETGARMRYKRLTAHAQVHNRSTQLLIENGYVNEGKLKHCSTLTPLEKKKLLFKKTHNNLLVEHQKNLRGKVQHKSV